MGEQVRYLGLERSKWFKTWRGVDVRTGFDIEKRTDIPSGFDVGICLRIYEDSRPGTVVWRVGQTVKKEGMVFIGLQGYGDVDRVRKMFKSVKVWEAPKVLLAQCEGMRTAQEVAA